MIEVSQNCPSADCAATECSEATFATSYLACDARLARMLLSGLPALLKFAVRESNAGIWLESSVQYALTEARTPHLGVRCAGEVS
jgi:hypothetical protein